MPRTRTGVDPLSPRGDQGQVDFAHVLTEFGDDPGVQNRRWLFAMELGHSCYLWVRYVVHQDLGAVLGCHMEGVSKRTSDGP